MIQLRDLWNSIHPFKNIMDKYHCFFFINLLRRKSGWICYAGKLKSKIAAILQWLNLSSEPRQNHCRSSHAIIPKSNNLLQQFNFLLLVLTMSIPLGTLLRRTRKPFRDIRSMIIYIKPLGFPISNLTTRSIWNIFVRHP